MTSAGSLLETSVAFLVWIALSARLARPRSSQAAHGWLLLALLGVALAATLSHPELGPSIEHATGVPHVDWLLRVVLLLIAAWAMLATFIQLQEPGPAAVRQIRQRALQFGCSIVLVIGLFAAAPADHQHAKTWQVAIVLGREPLMAACVGVYLFALGVAVVEVIRRSWQYAAAAARPTVRVGLRLIAAAALLGLGVIGIEAAILIGHRLGLTIPPAPLSTTLRLGYSIGIIVYALGTLVPIWLLYLTPKRVYGQLGPLEETTSPAQPPHRWSPVKLRDRLAMTHMLYRLYQRMLGIRDGRLELRPWISRQQADSAHQRGEAQGLAGADLAAYVDASVLPPTRRQHQPGSPVPSQGQQVQPGGATFTTEASFLMKVAKRL